MVQTLQYWASFGLVVPHSLLLVQLVMIRMGLAVILPHVHGTIKLGSLCLHRNQSIPQLHTALYRI